MLPFFPLSHSQPGPQWQPYWLELCMYMENLSIPSPDLTYSWHPLLCSSSYQHLITFPPSFHHPSMEMDSPKLHPTQALLHSAHTHWLQNPGNATNVTFVTPKDTRRSPERWPMLGQSAQFRDTCRYHANSTLQVPDLAGITVGSALQPQVRLLRKCFCSGPYRQGSESRQQCLFISCANMNII